MVLLCSASVFAQLATEYVDKLIRVGTAQAEMVPGKWYFIHSPRNANSTAWSFVMPGENVISTGGFVTDMGVDSPIFQTETSVVDELTNEEGANANLYLKNLVRFVPVEGEEGAYNIQFGTGNWVANSSTFNNASIFSVNHNNYMAGNAGKYNFYLVTIDSVPNNAGRFAWNLYNMQNRMDTNGTGKTVVFWNTGETTAEWMNVSADEDIIGNNIWQIYDVEVVGDLDKYAYIFKDLVARYTDYTSMEDGTLIDNLLYGYNVGTMPGNYRELYVKEFLDIHAQVEELLMLAEMEGLEACKEKYPTFNDLIAFSNDYSNAYVQLMENKVPMAMTGIKPGYYTFSSVMFFYTTKNDTIRYTQVEADAYNAECGYIEGDEGYVFAGDIKEIISRQVAAPKKSLYSASAMGSDGNMADWMAWGTQQPKAEFLWKIETVEGNPYEYRMINMLNGKTHISIGQSSNSKLAINDTATVCFDWRNDRERVKYSDANGNEVEQSVVSFTIRSSKQAENAYNYLHCGGHNSGTGQNGWILGWSDGGATRWYMTPVDEATVDAWVNGPEAQVRAMVREGNGIAAAFPEQLEIAKDIETIVYENDSVVVTADQFYSQYTTEDAQYIPEGQTIYDYLLDGNQSTYWHSKWENGSVGPKVHYLQINAAETMDGKYAVKLQRRPVSGDHITELIAVGYVNEPTDETTFQDGKELGTLKLPFASNSETVVSSTFDATGMNYIRFYSNATVAATSGGGKGRGYWHASGFNVFKAEEKAPYATTQYEVRKDEADELAYAIELWNKMEFSEDNAALIGDETFQKYYHTLIAASQAWNAVFVDPTALRQAIAEAPAEKLFVTGNNPGQWKEGTVTPASVLAAAQAYNASGAYTPAETEAHIAAIANAETDVFASANKVETGKWYRFKYATEEMYDKYEWSKAGANSLVHEDSGIEMAFPLFGRTVAVGKSITTFVPYEPAWGGIDTVEVRHADVTGEWYEGDNLCFYEDVNFGNGEDLFRFIQATDSSYMIQNKATGLFINATGHDAILSAIPTYFTVEAMGAGANLIGYTDVLGASDLHRYLHGERQSGKLVKWGANTLGSNSMMFIEEVETVTEEPSTEYYAKMWPGQLYARTMPVDVTVGEGATAYTAGLSVEENLATITLEPIESGVVKAGTPFIMIADLDGEYISTGERLEQITAEITREEGGFGREESYMASERLNDEYAIVSMNHGMVVSTEVTAQNSLRGTLQAINVLAGEALLPAENGFSHTYVRTAIPANAAFVASDFDANAPLPNLNVVFGEIGDSIVVPDDTTSVVDPVRTPLITDASQLSSPFTCPDEGALEYLIDGDHASFWHSDWHGGAVEGGHYLQIALAEPVSGTFSLYMKRRNTQSDHPSVVRITGSETADFSSETLNILVEMPNAVRSAEAYSEEWTIENPTQYLRIEAVDCGGDDGFRGYWHAAELQVYQTGEGMDWTEIMADILLKLAAYPAMQDELQTAFDAYLSLPEDDENRVAVKAEVNSLYSIIQSAVKAYEQLPALIAQADSVLESNTDAELESACKAAKTINAETSISEEILSAYDALKKAVAPYLKLSIPMDQWNFTMWTYIMNGVQYHLDTEHGLARVRMTLQGDFRAVTSVDVPETITYNGKEYHVVAMGGAENEYDNQLKSISLPSTLKVIEGGAFDTTPMLKDIIVRAATAPAFTSEWTGTDNSRVKVIIPNGSINSYRLANVWSEYLLVQQTPVEINIANAETGELGYLVMEHVDYLQEVNKLTIASGTLNSTDWNVLKSMTNLIELDIEGISNDYITENQFSYSKLEAIRLPKNLREVSSRSFNYSYRLSSVVLPDSVKALRYSAFSNCNNLKEVALNEGLELIEGYAFSSCDIRSITIPSSVRRIEDDAFAYNRNMTELNIMEGVEEINYNAFNDCDALTEVTLPSTLLRCVRSFNSCDNLTTIISNAIVPAYTENYCPVTGSDLSKVVLKVPVWSIDDYKFAPGWSQIPVVEASEYQPETIIIRKDYTFRLKETDVDSTYRPNIVLKWSDVWSYDDLGHHRAESGNLTINPSRKLNAKSFSMFYSPYAKYWDDRNRMYDWYDNTKYNTNSLLVKGDMRADDATITLMNRNGRWQFVSFPFEVRMSDIVPVEANTQWVVRKYSGLERANGNMDSTWVELTANDVLEAGKGYIMHCHSDNGEPVMFQVKPNTASVTRQNIFKSADMEVALEEHVSEFEHNSSWNLVGNPYPCYFDSRFMDFSAPITVWNSYENNYMAYSPVDDDYVLYPGEAFFVQRPVDQESIVFMADGRQTNIYSREMANARSYAAADRMVYNIVLKGEKTSDRTRVVLNEKASMGYEMSCDASKFAAMSNEVSQIFTMVGNTRMAINERPVGNGCVELGMTIASEGVYTIALKQAGEKTVVLEDREMGVTTVLSADSEYTFSAMPGEAKGRFFLHFNGGETGINGVGAADAEKAPAFNTAGVRVEETQQGIVIKEGKKIMNK